MEKIELSCDGLQKISEHIEKLQDKTAKATIDPTCADRCIKEIRSELFELLKTIRSQCVIVNDAGGPDGPRAA